MIIALGFAAAYLILLGIVLRSRTRRDPAEGWLLGYCAYSAVLMGIHALALAPSTVLALAVPAQIITIIGFMISITLTGVLTFAYLALSRRARIVWGILIAAWVASVGLAELTGAPSITSGQSELLAPFSDQSTLSLELLVFGWLALALLQFLLVARTFLAEQLPLYANRILFWFIVIPVLLMGDALSAWLNSPWNYIGYGVRLIGAVGAVYGVVAYRILDLRHTLRWLIGRSVLTVVTGLVVLGGVLTAYNVPLALSEAARWLIAIGIALAVAILMQPLRQFIRVLLRRLIDRGSADAAEAIRLYSQRISGILDLRDLAGVATRTVNELLSARRACLILATQQGETLLLEAVGSDRAEHIRSGNLSESSPIYGHFMSAASTTLLQYDIDYHKDYLAVPPDERRYFTALEMDIYAPIVGDSKLIGMLALGPKSNGDPFRPTEMGLLTALANQTVAALENARLVTDLRNLNVEISVLNQDLRATNERLERLDAVKSDFISIASHELRTPLTQIQGYADLLTEMSERSLLSPEQTMEIMTSLRRASQRMGEVISSMLDVSQIDVENMDLNFVETSLASIVKLAIEPYGEAIHARNMTLVARGLRNLPPVHGDYKRLVQAFENLITNAIKFTPDGGKINVTGEIFEKESDGRPKNVRITIEDNGIGIPKEFQDLIFEKFYRVGSTTLHSTGTTKFKGAGPGLGLPIARGIIDGHGGRIWVESEGYSEESRPGSSFHVVLPIHPPAMDARERMTQLQESAEESDTAVASKPKV